LNSSFFLAEKLESQRLLDIISSIL